MTQALTFDPITSSNERLAVGLVPLNLLRVLLESLTREIRIGLLPAPAQSCLSFPMSFCQLEHSFTSQLPAGLLQSRTVEVTFSEADESAPHGMVRYDFILEECGVRENARRLAMSVELPLLMDEKGPMYRTVRVRATGGDPQTRQILTEAMDGAFSSIRMRESIGGALKAGMWQISSRQARLEGLRVERDGLALVFRTETSPRCDFFS
jgi:hypothetical protein